MTFNTLPPTSSKRRRIMIITADEEIIDQIEKTNDASLLTQIVLESQSGNSKNDDQQTTKQLSEQTSKTNHGPLTCVVCGSSANGHNFGAIVCESCKAFFRRNATKHPAIFQCRKKRDCEIRIETRRNCPACRLAKCYNSGMQRDRLSTNEQKAAKRRRIEENRALTLHSTSKINKRQYQQSSSIASDDLLLPIDTDILHLSNFSDLLSPQPEQVSLAPEDLQQVETISLLYQRRIELATRDGLPWDPSIQTSTFLQILNSHSVAVMRLLSFFKQIPEFNQLNTDDKVTLIKYNLPIVLSVSSALSYNIETGQIIETDSDAPWNIQLYQLVHGHNTCVQSRKIFHSFLHIANYDKKIIQLSLIALILTKGFSISNSNEPILNDIKAVYHAQNYYIELLWKYMEATHGSEVAVRLFTQLIVNVISWQTIQEDMQNNLLRILSPKDIDELVPIMKSLLRLS